MGCTLAVPSVSRQTYRRHSGLGLSCDVMPPKGAGSGGNTDPVQDRSSRALVDACERAGCKCGPLRRRGHDHVVVGPQRAVSLGEATRILDRRIEPPPRGVEHVELKAATVGGSARAGWSLQFKSHRASTLIAEPCTVMVFSGELRPIDVRQRGGGNGNS